MKTADTNDIQPLTEAQLAQLRASDDRVPDTVDIPELTDEQWRSARRFYKPLKQAISIRVDADILDWLKHRSERYQVEINRILREKMNAETVG